MGNDKEVLDRIEGNNDTLFNKVRGIQAKIIWATGAGAVIVFIVLKLIERYWK